MQVDFYSLMIHWWHVAALLPLKNRAPQQQSAHGTPLARALRSFSLCLGGGSDAGCVMRWALGIVLLVLGWAWRPVCALGPRSAICMTLASLCPWAARHFVRAAKEMDSKSIGLCPQGFESPRCRFAPGRQKQSVASGKPSRDAFPCMAGISLLPLTCCSAFCSLASIAQLVRA